MSWMDSTHRRGGGKFIIGDLYLNSVIYADDIIFITNTLRKLHELLLK